MGAAARSGIVGDCFLQVPPPRFASKRAGTRCCRVQDLTPETAHMLFQVVDTDLVKCPHMARPRTNSIHTNHRPRRERARAWGARGLVRLGSVLLFCADCFLRPLIIPIPYPDWLSLLLIGSAALTSIGPLPRPRPMSWARAVGRPGENPACLGFGGGGGGSVEGRRVGREEAAVAIRPGGWCRC